MAAQKDLAKIGSQGFALIDEYFTTFRATQQCCNYHYSSGETHVYRVNASIRREAMITAPIPMVALSSYEAAQLHDLLGTIICKIVGCCFYVENS